LKPKKQSKEKVHIPFWDNPNVIAIESLIATIVTIYYGAAVFQYIMLKILLGNSATLTANGIFLDISYSNQKDLSVFQQGFFICIPYLLSVVIIEATNYLVKRSKNASRKTFLLFMQLSLFSFFLFSLLFFVISLVFSVKIVDSWQMLILQLKPDFQYKIIIALIITVVIFGYFGSVLGRLKNYFSSQESNNS
jgi:hypothetical protein